MSESEIWQAGATGAYQKEELNEQQGDETIRL